MAGGLDAYRNRRDFAKTAEPAGGASARRKGRAAELSFVVQKHAARRLHYDLRLELDGVYRSWAVTEGPSLVPGEKRLAVEVEDHPLDYGTFEGTIPKGEYGAGAVLVWDRGVWSPDGDPHAGIAEGRLDFELRGEKLRGRWHLVRLRPRRGTKRPEWLLIKARDEAAREPDAPDILEQAPASVKTGRGIEEIARRGAEEASVPPAFVEPCLAALVETTPTDPKFVHEIKFDGYRIQAATADGRVVLRTRSGQDWTTKFEGAPFLDALRRLPGRLLLDGELVVEADTGRSDFTALQDDIAKGRKDRMVYVAFDLLHRNGEDLRPRPLLERKAALEALLAPRQGPALRYGEHLDESGERLLEHACRLGLEGIVSKRRNAPYRSGRSKDWVKSKCAVREDFVIAGFVPSTTTKRAVGALVLGVHDGGKLVHAGRVGSGFTADASRTLFALLEPERIDARPFATKLPAGQARDIRFVAPNRVAEVEFRGRTSGGLLRHAVFKGLREDASAADVVRREAEYEQEDAPHPAVVLTHPDRLLWPDAGVTKQGLADFYVEIGDRILPHVTGRILSLVRCPDGVAGHCFFQKHAWKGLSDAVARVPVPGDDEPGLAISDLDGLIALVQAAVLEIHPWGSRAEDAERPDRLIFDLDPGEDVGWDAIAAVAFAVRDRLAADGLRSFAKTTGGKGLHVVVPIRPASDWATVKSYCRNVAETLAAAAPERRTASLAKKARRGRVFIDHLRNGRGATAVAAYSTRARPGAPVALPVAWEELSMLRRADLFRVVDLPARLDRLREDPWKDFFTLEQRLPDDAAGATERAAPRRGRR